MNAAAPWLLPTNGRITVPVKPGIGAYTRFRTLPAVPWLHVRNQEKRFPREHFAFARQESDFFVSISLLLVSKSDFLVSVSLLLVSKSDFLVADELASFSDDPAQLYVGSVDGARFCVECFGVSRCRSQMRILAAIEDPVVPRKILDSLGLPSRAPPVAPARHNRQDELAQF